MDISTVSIPGSFLPDQDAPPAPDGARPHSPLFRPPQNSSASSSLLKSSFSTPQASSLYASSASASRKRARYDPSTSLSLATPNQITLADWDPEPASLLSSASFSSATSPAPFVSTDYRLAGGLDTPTAATAAAYERQDDYGFELYHRPSRYAQSPQRDPDGYFPRTPNSLSKERHGRRLAQSLQENNSWSKVVRSLVTGVAGRLFDFCWNGAFRGFHAGGGPGYQMGVTTPTMLQQSSWQEFVEKEDVFQDNNKKQRRRGSTPVPGQFPDASEVKDQQSHSPFGHGRRLSKSTTFDGGGDGNGSALKAGWVIVGGSVSGAKDGSPSLSSSRLPRRSLINEPRAISRASVGGGRPSIASSSPSHTETSTVAYAQSASYASPRRQSQRQSITSPRATPSGGHHRRSSSSNIISPRRSDPRKGNSSMCTTTTTTTTSPDVAKFEKRVRRKEREDDQSIQRLNQQLKDMIREGKQALGTRIDIEDDNADAEMEDEGYGEGTELLGESKW